MCCSMLFTVYLQRSAHLETSKHQRNDTYYKTQDIHKIL